LPASDKAEKYGGVPGVVTSFWSAGVSLPVPVRLARYFGGTAQFWLNQSIYDLRTAECFCQKRSALHVSTQQHEPTFPRKRILTTILNMRRNLLHYKVEVGRLATELAV
jgi:hypothetical protein